MIDSYHLVSPEYYFQISEQLELMEASLRSGERLGVIASNLRRDTLGVELVGFNKQLSGISGKKSPLSWTIFGDVGRQSIS